MVTLQTYFIYLLLFVVMLFLAKRASERNEWFWMILAILLYAIVFGLRYGVGVDHLAYLADYMRYGLAASGQYDDTEIGFKFFRDTLAQNDIHFSVYFVIIAFVQLWLVFKAVQKDKFIYPYLVVAFFLGCIWLSYSNGLRQQLAFCFFAYSLLFIENKKLKFKYKINKYIKLCLNTDNVVKNSIHIPYENLLTNYKELLDKNKKYFIYCKGGIKSRKVVNILSFYGYDVTLVY